MRSSIINYQLIVYLFVHCTKHKIKVREHKLRKTFSYKKAKFRNESQEY